MPLWLQFILFLTVALGILGGAHYYLWRRLARDTGLPSRWRHVLRLVFVLGVLAFPLEHFVSRTVGGSTSVVFAYFAYGWMGFCFYAFVLLLAADLVLLVLWRHRRRPRPAGAAGRDGPPEDPERRRALRRIVNGGAAVASGGILVSGAFSAFADPEVTDLPVRLPRLPRALSGVTIAQLTDVHFGGIVDERFVRRMVESTNRLKPDAVVITGDLFDRTADRLGGVLPELRRLQSRFGTFFVTGNHEFYTGVEPLCAALRGIGVTVLRNQRVPLGDGAASIDLLGVDDWNSGRPRRARPGPAPAGGHYDLDAALAGRDPQRASVLLAHQPRDFEKAAAAGVGLQLSGHTHGGQMFPIIGISKLAYRWVAGHYRLGESHIYVSRGVGFWGPPFRVLAPPEIVKITLV